MNNLKSLVLLCFIVFITACAKTTVTVKSDPPGARAIFDRTGITAITDEKVTVESSFFKSGEEVLNEHIVFEKEGFRTREISKELKKGEDHIIGVALDKLDTFVDIKSMPVLTHLEFVGNNGKNVVEYRSNRTDKDHNKLENNNQYTLPNGWPKQFVTPIHLESTQDEAQQVMRSVKLMMPDDTGFLPTGDYLRLIKGGLDLNLIMGATNEINIVLKPVVTTLRVKSSPPGAVVEDISSGGFENIGKTPVIRHFNWNDVQQWLQKHKNERLESDGERSIVLDLKITKPGYKVTFLKGVRIPVGEERSFNKKLKPLITKISFSSEPAGVDVYVERQKKEDIKTSNGLSTHVEISRKFLGTTPFNKSVGLNGPLQHGEKLLFEKDGYIGGDMRFSKNKNHYHKVMRTIDVNER